MVPAFITLVVAVWLSASASVNAYSVLAHESAIDAAWDRELRPLLVPKAGPLKPLAFKAPTPDVDRLFENSSPPVRSALTAFYQTGAQRAER